MDLRENISQRDADIITQVVDLFLHEGLGSVKRHLICIFGKDITCDHFIIMGQVIGLKRGADFETPKQTFFSYGQSHN